MEQLAISEGENWEKENNVPEPMPRNENAPGNGENQGALPQETTLSTTVEHFVESTSVTDAQTVQSTLPAVRETGLDTAPVPSRESKPSGIAPAETSSSVQTGESSRGTLIQTTAAGSQQVSQTRQTETSMRVTIPAQTQPMPDNSPQQDPNPNGSRRKDPDRVPEREKNPNASPQQPLFFSGKGVVMPLSQEVPAAVTTTIAETTTLTTISTKTVTITESVATSSRTTRPNPPDMRENEPGGRPGESVTIDHFLCCVDPDGMVVKTEGTEDYTSEEIQTLADSIMQADNASGTFGTMQYVRHAVRAGTVLVFTDRSAQQLVMRNILWISIVVFFLMEGVVLILTMLLTKRAMQPMYVTFERQRQFISDAGHELKTPLTIISANVDILQDEIGENKWLSYIRSQTERMCVLISDMMNLSKLDFGESRQSFKQFSLSNAVSGAALPFESQAFEQHKKLELDIQDGIVYTGNIDQIKQLVGIFIDNAIKYSDEKGEIRVTLRQVKDKKTLKFYNTGIGVREEEKEKIFARFYRSDASRTRSTGGYGLGLSIAMQIMEQHKIRVQVESEYGKWVCFTLVF